MDDSNEEQVRKKSRTDGEPSVRQTPTNQPLLPPLQQTLMGHFPQDTSFPLYISPYYQYPYSVNPNNNSVPDVYRRNAGPFSNQTTLPPVPYIAHVPNDLMPVLPAIQDGRTVPPRVTIPVEITFTNEECDPYQIANYNLQPSVTVRVKQAREDMFVVGELVEIFHNTLIKGGILSGHIQPTTVGEECEVVFDSIKLNKMGFLKEELSKSQLLVKASLFCIRFRVDDSQHIDTRSFRIVSSFSQLPKDIRDLRTARASGEKKRN